MPAKQRSRLSSLARPTTRFDPRQHTRSKWGLLTVALGLWPSLTGCIDPDGKYDDFLKRKAASQVVPDAGDPGVEADAGPVVLPEPEQLNGNYLYVVALAPYTTQPTIYELEVKAERKGDVYSISTRDRPLKFATLDMYVGEWNEWTTSTVEPTGVYTTPNLHILTPKAANVLAVDTESMLIFSGNVGDARIADGGAGLAEFWCGTVTGNLVLPISQPLTGAFTATRITNPKNLPEPVISCAGDKAAFGP